MLRFYLLIILNMYRIPYYLIKMIHYAKHPEKYDEEKCYALLKKITKMMQRSARITTTGYGFENLPSEGGYLVCPNHQGRYDLLSVVSEHSEVCSFVVDDARSHMPITSQVCDMLHAKRMVRGDLKQSLQVILDVAEDLKKGKKIIIFPEGTYAHDHAENKLGEFKAGCFKAATRSKAPIVPVAIIDSYKAFEGHKYNKVFTETHFLSPILYDEYKDLSTRDIAELVKQRIADAIADITEAKKLAHE